MNNVIRNNDAAIILSAALWILITACGRTSMTSGEAVFLFDEAVYPAIGRQHREFSLLYPDAKVRLRSGAPSELIRRWLSGESAALLVTRRMDSNETRLAEETGKMFTMQKVALDGLAVIVHHRKKVSSVTVGQLRRICAGEIQFWRDWSAEDREVSDTSGILLLLEQDSSGNTQYLRSAGITCGDLARKIIYTGEPNRPASAQIMEAVASRENAIGLVSTAWLSDNPDYLSYYSLIRVLDVGEDDLSGAVEPIPGYLYRGDYPLRRLIYLYVCQNEPDPAAGFASFLCGNEGQKLFLENNLVPVINPVRLRFK